MITKLNETLITAHNLAVPTIIPGQYNLIIPEDILKLIKLRNMYRQKWQRHRRNREFKRIYYGLRNLIKLKLNNLRNSNWNKNLIEINRYKDKRQGDISKLFK